MSRQIPIGLLITGAVMVLAFLAPAVIVFAIRAHKRATCTVQTAATIIAFKSDSKGGSHPIYEYRASGQTFTEASAFTSTAFERTHEIGSAVTLFYNPNKPRSIYVPDENVGINILIGGFVGFACLVACIFGVIALRYMR